MVKGKQIKREYVEAVYRILSEEGFEEITIRRLAKDTGRNSASLYYYFDSLRHLISIASIRYLVEYYDVLSSVENNHYEAMEINLQSWVCLAWFAFRNVPIYENFFLYDIESSENALHEYFMIFPEDKSTIDNYFLNDCLLTLDLRKRDRWMLVRAVEDGAISQESVDYLVDSDYYLFCGMMNELRYTYRDEKAVDESLKKYGAIMTETYRRSLLSGHSILGCHLETLRND